MKQSKNRLSFWQIWNMSFGFLGIQFGFALQGGNMSRISKRWEQHQMNFRDFGLRPP